MQDTARRWTKVDHAGVLSTSISPPSGRNRVQKALEDDNETRISALGAPMSPAWAHGCPHVEDLALPKSLRSGTFTLAKAVIWWMSVQNPA
jgi:hypothetical protein